MMSQFILSNNFISTFPDLQLEPDAPHLSTGIEVSMVPCL